MSQIHVAVCDRCAHTARGQSLLEVRVRAEEHGRKAGHDVRVFVTECWQIGFWNARARRYEVNARLDEMQDRARRHAR